MLLKNSDCRLRFFYDSVDRPPSKLVRANFFSLSLLWATPRTKEIPGCYCLKPQISGSYCLEIIRRRPCDALTRSPNPVKPALSRDNGVLCSHWLTGACCPLIGSPGPGTAESADLAKGWRPRAMASDEARFSRASYKILPGCAVSLKFFSCCL